MSKCLNKCCDAYAAHATSNLICILWNGSSGSLAAAVAENSLVRLCQLEACSVSGAGWLAAENHHCVHSGTREVDVWCARRVQDR